jgi:vacuolar-type H+-ATPase subunit E/Vma4
MSLERITEHILEQARQNAQTAVEAAGKEAEEKLAEARRREEELLAEQVKGLETELERERQQETARRRTDQRAELLRVKTKIVEGIFTEAREKVLGSGAYREWLKERLKTSGVASGKVVCRAEDRGVMEQLLKELGLTGITVVKEGSAPAGGFILRTEKYDLDVTLEAELAELREELTGELVERLSAQE